MGQTDVQATVCGLLADLAENNRGLVFKSTRVRIAELGGIEAIVKAIDEHGESSMVQVQCLGALGQLAAYNGGREVVEGPRAPAVKLTARHSSLTTVRASPLSPLLVVSELVRSPRRQTAGASRRGGRRRGRHCTCNDVAVCVCVCVRVCRVCVRCVYTHVRRGA